MPTSLRTQYKWSGPDGFTKYNADDGKVTLDASDDAASVNLGEKWRMPTNEEITELRNKCTWAQATRNGVLGSIVTGPNGKSIFIPISEGFTAYFNAEILSSSLSTYTNDAYKYVYALSYNYGENAVYFLRTFRYWGTPVRPVYDDSGTNPEIRIPEPIDLGLPSGLKWASFNLGATKPEEYGDYYAWGETEPYYSSLDPLTWKEGKENGYYWPSYKWCMGNWRALTKYCSSSTYGYNGFTDTKTVLDPEDDAAHVNLGDKWRIPTDAEWTELRENCTWTWTTQNGVNGRLVTASNGNSIFLPAAGRRWQGDLDTVGSYGYYWSSSLSTDIPYIAWDVRFDSGAVDRSDLNRCIGSSVRPVYVE